MLKPLQVVDQLVGDFTKSPSDVRIDPVALAKAAEAAKNRPAVEKQAWPKYINEGDYTNLVLYELAGCAINYCYWYGTSTIRPNALNAAVMYDMLNDCFPADFPDVIYSFVKRMRMARYPLCAERAEHLFQLLDEYYIDFAEEVIANSEKEGGLVESLDKLMTLFPGYAEDMFLKRASLFFMQLYRRGGLYAKEIGLMPIPADYQVPRVLNGLGILVYSDTLASDIENDILIPKGSRTECEIRASTIAAGRELSKLTGMNSSDVDWWLWTRRKEAKAKFHLTLTTDY